MPPPTVILSRAKNLSGAGRARRWRVVRAEEAAGVGPAAPCHIQHPGHPELVEGGAGAHGSTGSP